MLAISTSTLMAHQHIGMRCNACRYFAMDRCCNASARLDGAADREGDCPFFRFALSATPDPVWELR